MDPRTCTECGKVLRADEHKVCDECDEEIAQAEDEENEHDFDE